MWNDAVYHNDGDWQDEWGGPDSRMSDRPKYRHVMMDSLFSIMTSLLSIQKIIVTKFGIMSLDCQIGFKKKMIYCLSYT